MSAQIEAYLSPYHGYRAPLSFPSVAASSYFQHQDSQRPPRSSFRSLPLHTSDGSNSTNAYMKPTLPQPPLQQSLQASPQHGVKRSVPDFDDEFEHSSHISTQFKRLRLNNNQTPQPNIQPHSSHIDVLPPASQAQRSVLSEQRPPSPQHQSIPTLPSDDFMTVDETPDKIYITDLVSEIASIEAAERASNQIFLPDFEKQIGAIPDHILRASPTMYRMGHGESSENSQALVLYKDPTSISVPEEEDAVRKAILEARRGIRERMRREQQRERETARIGLGRDDSRSGLPGVIPDASHESVPHHSEYLVEDGNNMPDYEDIMEIE